MMFWLFFVISKGKTTMMKILNNEKKIRWLFYLPAAVVFIAVGIYPTIYGVFMSMRSYRPGIEPVFVGFKNFIDLFNNSDMIASLIHTLYFVAASVFCELVIGFLLSLALTRGKRYESVFRSLLLLPMVMTPVAVGITWRFFFNSDYGIINYVLSFFGVPKLPWINSTLTALPSLVLVDIWQWTPFVILVLGAAKSALPAEPFEAALVDGASAFQRIKHIMFPLLKPAILVILLFRTVDCLKIFDIIYTITGGGPANSTETTSLLAYRVSFRFANFGYGMAISILLLIISIVASNLFVKLLRTKEED